jgi:hypothetical protein
MRFSPPFSEFNPDQTFLSLLILTSDATYNMEPFSDNFSNGKGPIGPRGRNDEHHPISHLLLEGLMHGEMICV